MAKDPAFLFYTSDFLTGTMLMNDEQVGKYIRLLCLQHQKGRLSKKHMLSICKAYDQDIFEKFKKEDDFFYNERLEDESIKRAKFAESRRNNAKGTKKKPLKSKKAYAQHMEDVNEDENEVKKEIVFPFDSEKFMEYWRLWKQYKKDEHKFTYKSIISEQSALKKLSNISYVNENNAIEILSEAMANGYKGFFELKNNTNGKETQQEKNTRMLNNLNADIANKV